MFGADGIPLNYVDKNPQEMIEKAKPNSIVILYGEPDYSGSIILSIKDESGNVDTLKFEDADSELKGNYKGRQITHSDIFKRNGKVKNNIANTYLNIMNVFGDKYDYQEATAIYNDSLIYKFEDQESMEKDYLRNLAESSKQNLEVAQKAYKNE